MIKENEVCKKIISEFLYPNDKVKKFLTRDLNEELNEIIDNNTLINEDNRVDSIRQSNLWENVKSVGNFLQKNIFQGYAIISNTQIIFSGKKRVLSFHNFPFLFPTRDNR